MSVSAFDMIVERLGVLEAQEVFEARRRRITRGDALGLPFTIEHAHSNANDAYWDGSYSMYSNRMFHVKIKCASYETAFSWYKQHMDVVSTEHATILDGLADSDGFGPTAVEAGFPDSPHMYLNDHIIELHLKTAIDSDFMKVRMAHCMDDFVRMLVLVKGSDGSKQLYVDDILRPVCDGLRRPDVFGQSFVIQKASIAEAVAGRFAIINAIEMGLSLSESGKTKFMKAINECDGDREVAWKIFGKHLPWDFGSCGFDGLNDAEHKIYWSFFDKMEKLALKISS